MQNRRSPRSPLHNYAESGAYFVTICVNERVELFGHIINELILNDAGKMVELVWQQIPMRFPTVGLDRYVIMPNHFHAIILLGFDNVDGQWIRLGEKSNPALSEVIAAFKSITTVEYTKGTRERNWTHFNNRLWQRSYFDRVIRNDEELERIRTYISNNPFRWYMDYENPHRQDIDEFDVWLRNL